MMKDWHESEASFPNIHCDSSCSGCLWWHRRDIVCYRTIQWVHENTQYQHNDYCSIIILEKKLCEYLVPGVLVTKGFLSMTLSCLVQCQCVPLSARISTPYKSWKGHLLTRTHCVHWALPADCAIQTALLSHLSCFFFFTCQTISKPGKISIPNVLKSRKRSQEKQLHE